MLVKLSKASASGQAINLEELGLSNIGELIEDMNENEKIIEDFQKPWDEKLAEAKAKSGLIDMEEDQIEEVKQDETEQTP